MSGPGLTRQESHHAIHEAAFAEAEELTHLLRRAALADDHARALQLVGVLMEHWQTRTLRHAEAEEQGWYRDLARDQPGLRTDITQLTRDHDLLRILLSEIEQILAVRGWVSGIVERFEAMLLLNAIHSRDEEQRLLGGREGARDGHASGTSSGAAPTGSSSAKTSMAEVPLAVTYPHVYHRGMERLSRHGIHPGDVRLTVRRPTDSGDGESLRAAFGRDFAEMLDMPLPDATDDTAIDREFDMIADACEHTVRSEYYAAMRITEPAAPGGKNGKRPRFNLTVLQEPRSQPNE